MIQFLNCQDHSYSYVLELTIRKQNQYKEIQAGIQKSPNPSKIELFSNQTALDHSKSEHVRYSSPHCNKGWVYFPICELDVLIKALMSPPCHFS